MFGATRARSDSALVGLIAAIVAGGLAPALAAPPDPCEGCAVDIDHDGALTAADVAVYEFAFAQGSTRADFNGDGSVTAEDRASYLAAHAQGCGVCPPASVGVPIVFVSRAIPDRGAASWSAPSALPGVGPHGRVRPAPPGRLMVREADGTLRTLIDGAAPSGATLNLIDVNAPAVSYDGGTIVFAGLPAGAWASDPGAVVNGWRLYVIGVDGAGLRQLTFEQPPIDYTVFGAAELGLQGFDDFDPVFLPDGRVCFSSTRWPSFAQHAAARTSNLFVVNLDGTRLRRITAERNGADRPLVDPETGRIVYFRWWRNHRYPTDSPGTVLVDPMDAGAGYQQHAGLTVDAAGAVGGPSMERNHWQIVAINTDGAAIAAWTGRGRLEEENHAYGGGFAPDGSLLANFFPNLSMTDAAGFGGIRRFVRGAEPWEAVGGVTSITGDVVHPGGGGGGGGAGSPSTGVFWGRYFAEPEALPDGRVIVSWAPNIHQDYGLYVLDPATGGLSVVRDLAGFSELRARVIGPRPIPPTHRDIHRDFPDTPAPSLAPPPERGPYDIDGASILYPLNVYANAPVDVDIISAPPVGSASVFRVFIDHQRTSPGSLPSQDWPIRVQEYPIRPDGSAIVSGIPAYVPLFEQVRGPAPGAALPRTGGYEPDGAGHVAGMNFVIPGSSQTCVGCHAGHSLMPEGAGAPESALFSNLAPGAIPAASSSRDALCVLGLVDRKAIKGEIWRCWTSAPGQQAGQWVELTFPVPVTVRAVRLYNLRPGDEADSSVQAHAARVRLFTHVNGRGEAARGHVGEVATAGTVAPFSDVRARVVRVELTDVSGTFNGALAAGLAEVEVIARGEAADSLPSAPPEPGDVNFDGAVDSADLAILLGAWGTENPPAADIDGDGAVGSADLALALGNWGGGG